MTCAEFQALQAAAADDPQPLIENALWITTKGLPGQPPLTRLVLNKPQQRVHGALMQMRAAELPPRAICLKARQPGISTLGLAELLTTTLCRPHTMSMLIAHVDEAAEKLFRRILFMVERLPPDLRPRMRPPRKDEIYFEAMPCSDGDVPLQSSISVATASGREVWRSQTLTSVLLSEYARFPYPEATLLGVMQSVAKSPGTLVLIESTAQGMGNSFHTQYVRAEAGESAFVAVFIPWFDCPDSTMAAPADFEPDEEEWAIKRAYGLTNDQLQWRRYAIATDCQGDIDRFNQEHPTTASGSFLATGLPAFDAQRVSLMYERARTREPERGEWTERGFLPMRKGRLALWARPIAGHEYVIGADIATGIEGGDLSAVCIFDRTISEQVGEWAGYMTPIEFAQVLIGLGHWYNEAILAPEVNTHGFAVVEELKRAYYEKIHRWQRVDRVKNTVTWWLGWETSFKSRGLMIDSMDWAIRKGEIMLWSLELLREMQGFQYVSRRRAEGLDHDDRLFSAMIAYRVHLENPLDSTGFPPFVAEPVLTGAPPTPEVPLPARNVDRQVWEEVDDEMRTQGTGRRPAWQEYGTEPEPDPQEKPFWPGGDW